MEWEEIFTNHLSYKGLVSKICKGLLKLNSTKKTLILKKGAKDFNSHLPNLLENLGTHKHLYVNHYGSFIDNCPKQEAIKMFSNR